ncbi:hypothetical protein, partial [Acinetobacter baumannii]|uniref:hypothetical protein n=1 Tax=Acinetobacter baumannii TaxID=470 RepID=UPI003AFB760B
MAAGTPWPALPARAAAAGAAQDGHDRFAAFAYAAAGLMAETDGRGALAFLAGALLPQLGAAAPAMLGGPARELVAPVD